MHSSLTLKASLKGVRQAINSEKNCMLFRKSMTRYAFAILAMVGTFSFAQADAKSGEQAIRSAISQNLPRVSVKLVESTQIPGIYQVELDTGEWIYMSADGQYVLTGDLLKLQAGGVQNLTENARGAKRIEVLNGVQDKDLVIFKAQGQQKGEVFVFTDPSCGYCVKFHHDIPELNKLGITVKYLAWPRGGLQSAAGQTMVNVWCTKNRQGAMDRAKNNQPVARPDGECSTEQVQSQIQLGLEMGVRGTPAVYSKDGRQVGGYLPPAQLAGALGI